MVNKHINRIKGVHCHVSTTIKEIYAVDGDANQAWGGNPNTFIK